MEEAAGGRMHYMFNRVGGLKEDLPAGWLKFNLSSFPRRNIAPALTYSYNRTPQW